jgi:hypothetical protein
MYDFSLRILILFVSIYVLCRDGFKVENNYRTRTEVRSNYNHETIQCCSSVYLLFASYSLDYFFLEQYMDK